MGTKRYKVILEDNICLVFDNISSFRKFLKHYDNYDRNVNHICYIKSDVYDYLLEVKK